MLFIEPKPRLVWGICSTISYMKMIPSFPAEKRYLPSIEALIALTSPKWDTVSPYLYFGSSRRNLGGIPYTVRLPRLVPMTRFSIRLSAETTFMISVKHRASSWFSNYLSPAILMQAVISSSLKILREPHTSFWVPTVMSILFSFSSWDT